MASGAIIYSYVDGNPLSYVDPMGLCKSTDDKDCLQKALNSYSTEESLNDILGFGLGSALAGGGLQAWNKTAQKTVEEAGKMISGGGPSGTYTSYTRRWFGNASYGKALGRTAISTVASKSGIIGAGAAAWVLHGRALLMYLQCVSGESDDR